MFALLESLEKHYAKPMLKWLKRRLSDREEAKDVRQKFWEYLSSNRRIIERAHKSHAAGTPLRSIILTKLKDFMHAAREAADTIKRGGLVTFVPLKEWEDGGNSVDTVDDAIFDQEWARAVFKRARTTLRDEYANTPLKRAVLARPREMDKVLAKEFGVPENTVKSTRRRLRIMLGGLLRAEIVFLSPGGITEKDVDDELHYLIRCLGYDEDELL